MKKVLPLLVIKLFKGKEISSPKRINNSAKKCLFLYFIVAVTLSLSVNGQLPTAQQITSKMKVGWNLGNTLEVVWGSPGTATQAFIDSVKAAGFNTVRLPVAWFYHSDTITNIIDEGWLANVKKVVDYCVNDSLYVIINAHWDKGWLENRVNIANQTQVNERQEAYWTQIAEYFKNYDEHLLFAGANEPNVSDATGMSVLLSYHQTFVDAVRATGGNNSSRTLIIQGPSTDIDKTNTLMNKMPTDQIADRLMIEVHYYTPYQFCLMDKDADWGKMFYYWGKGNHSKTDVSRNATWGEESDVEKYFGLMKTNFIDKGIPVILGEFAAMTRTNLTGDNQALHLASRQYYYKYVVKSAIIKGIIPYCWDTGYLGLFNFDNGDIIDPDVVKAIMQGAKDATTAYVPSVNNSTLELFPNPFSSSFTLKVEKPEEIVRVSIFDMLGKNVENIKRSAFSNFLALGTSLKPNMYVVQVYGVNWTRSIQALKKQ